MDVAVHALEQSPVTVGVRQNSGWRHVRPVPRVLCETTAQESLERVGFKMARKMQSSRVASAHELVSHDDEVLANRHERHAK
jgi:hypothetical protein